MIVVYFSRQAVRSTNEADRTTPSVTEFLRSRPALTGRDRAAPQRRLAGPALHAATRGFGLTNAVPESVANARIAAGTVDATLSGFGPVLELHRACGSRASRAARPLCRSAGGGAAAAERVCPCAGSPGRAHPPRRVPSCAPAPPVSPSHPNRVSVTPPAGPARDFDGRGASGAQDSEMPTEWHASDRTPILRS